MVNNGWTRDKELIEFRLKDGDKKFEEIYKMLWDLREEIVAMKVKAGIWGIIGGSIPVLITILVGMFVWLVKS